VLKAGIHGELAYSAVDLDAIELIRGQARWWALLLGETSVLQTDYRGEDSYGYGALLYTELTGWFGADQVLLDVETIPAATDFTAVAGSGVVGMGAVGGDRATPTSSSLPPATSRAALVNHGKFGIHCSLASVTEPLERLERRIEDLRTEVRRAAMAGDPGRARQLRVELRQAEREWEDALTAVTPASQQSDPVGHPGPLPPIRDQAHEALTFLGVPAAPKLIVSVHGAFYGGEMTGAQLASVRRDEDRSFRSAPLARPYYLCSALTADRLVPARGLLAVSTWPMARRMIGPLSARVDFLRSAIAIAEQVYRLPETTLPALTLLWRFAANIPGAAQSIGEMRAIAVAEAARAELAIHEEADRAHREAAADRARTQLDMIHQMFGSTLNVVSRNTRKN